MNASVERILLGGSRKSGPLGSVYEVRDPWSGGAVGRVESATAEDAGEAVVRAGRGFAETKALPAYARATILSQIASRIRERGDSFAELITRETGKPIQYSTVEVERAIFTFQTAAEEAKRIGGEVIPLDLAAASAGRFGLTRRFPLGIVLGITPFNYPLNLVAHKVAPAIAAGNAFILKPAPQAPLTSLLLGEVIAETAFPKEAFSILPASNEVAEQLVRDERIAMLSFTGSANVGWRLKTAAGRKKVLLELGGNAGVIVDAGVPLEETVKKNVLGSFVSSGQVCIKVQRIFVHEQIFDVYLRRFVELTKSLAVGDSHDPATVVGPLIDDSAADRVEAWIRNAVRGGAVLHCGGGRRGRVIEPAVLTGVGRSCEVYTEEVFGPVTTLHPFRDIDEAIAGVNDTRYGLQAGIFSNVLSHILAAFERLDVGAVVVNDNPSYRIDHMPYGGIKHSGFGREGIRYAVEAMTEPKLLVVHPS